MEIYLKISKLLLAHKTQNISAQETEELLAWRQEKTENEELFQKISQADGFEQFRQQYEEYDFTPKFLLLEQKIKQEKRKRIIKRLSYAAILLPFIFAIWEIIQFQNQGTTPTEYSSIAPGSSRAILTIGKDKTIYIERDSNINIHKIDSNVFIQHNTLQYKKTAQATDNEIHKLNIPRGGEFFVCLSDGTKVWLNSESELKYASEFVGEERRVYLTGEAYFEVAHNPNKPFFVEAKNLQIQVLGTSFGVRVYKDEDYALTTLEEGQVNIHTATSSVTLKPGEQAKLHDNEITVNKVNTCSYTAWRNGKYIFINEPLGNIMKTLARWYDINIFYTSSKLEQIQFTGELIRYKNIEELLSKFIQLIIKHYKENRTLDFYAEKLFISTKYMSDIIKKTSGLTAHDWIDRYTILEAKILLRSTNKTIQEISNELNFPNHSFFSKYFKHHMGMTPKAYRQS